MAKQTTVTLIDDLDGGQADEQVQFSVDGKSYDIDLSTKNAKKLRDGLAPYVSAARRASRSGSSGAASSSSPSDRAMNRAVREWAVAQGMKISERGRIPSSVLEAYREAH